MAHRERNDRTAGYRRVNAVYERARAKAGRPPDRGRESMRDSLVLLTRSVPRVGGDAVRRAAVAAFADDPGAKVATVSPTGVVVAGGWSFGVEVGPRPYFDDPGAAAAAVPELRLRDAVRTHAGWLAVDLFDAPGAATAADCLARVGRLLAALAPEDAAALHRPFTGRVGLFTDAAAAALAGGRVDEAFRPADRPVPIAAVSDDDPRMAEAAAEAGRRFGEFLAALTARRPGETFAVKAPFADEHGQEFMWVAVAAVDDTHVHGRLDNDPAFVRSVRAGEPVSVPRDRVNDWLYVRGGELHGGFTLKLLGDRLRRTG